MEAIVSDGARAGYSTVPAVIYRNTVAREDGVASFLDRYNDGRRIQPILISPMAPLRWPPYFGSTLRWMLPAAAIILLAGLFLRPTRILASVGVATLLTTAAVFGFLLMENVRFIIVPLMFLVAIATAFADGGWCDVRRHSVTASRGAEHPPSTTNVARDSALPTGGVDGRARAERP